MLAQLYHILFGLFVCCNMNDQDEAADNDNEGHDHSGGGGHEDGGSLCDGDN